LCGEFEICGDKMKICEMDSPSTGEFIRLTKKRRKNNE
jgi:hypothetical protein